MEKVKILIIDDDKEICEQASKILHGKILNGFELQIDTLCVFKEGMNKIKEKEYDLLILDLCEGSPSLTAPKPGKDIMEEVKSNCFIPVIFFTGLPAYVEKNGTNLIRVVQKGSGAFKKLEEEIGILLQFNFVHIKRRLNGIIQKSLKETFWDFVDKEWDKIEKAGESFSLGYLAIRRLSKLLSRESIATVLNDKSINPTKVHPLEFYICPPVGTVPDMGDILSHKNNFFIVMNPSCDLCQKNNDYVVISKCIPLSENKEYKVFVEKRNKDSKINLGRFIGSRGRDRYYFLPKNEFIGMPDSYLDFEQVYNIKKKNIGKYKKVAHLDSMFAADILTRFARFYNRTGSSDIDGEFVIKYIEQQLPATPPKEDVKKGAEEGKQT